MTAESSQELLRDSFERVRELVVSLVDGLTPEVSSYRPDDQANPIGWLLWHTARIQDDHVADLAEVDQAWGSWRAKLDLPLDDWDTGYGHSPSQVASVRVDPALVVGYHRDVHELTLRYLHGLSADELARVVDRRWDPPVTASARLVSVLGDALQHLGQAAYVRGLAERAGRGR